MPGQSYCSSEASTSSPTLSMGLPLRCDFPIGLVLAAAGAELLAILTRRATWRAIAVANVRAGAAMGAVTAIAGWTVETS